MSFPDLGMLPLHLGDDLTRLLHLIADAPLLDLDKVGLDLLAVVEVKQVQTLCLKLLQALAGPRGILGQPVVIGFEQGPEIHPELLGDLRIELLGAVEGHNLLLDLFDRQIGLVAIIALRPTQAEEVGVDAAHLAP